MDDVESAAADLAGDVGRGDGIGAEAGHELLLEAEEIGVLEELAGARVYDVSGLNADGVGVDQGSAAVEADGLVAGMGLFAVRGADFVEEGARAVRDVAFITGSHAGDPNFLGSRNGIQAQRSRPVRRGEKRQE